MWSECLSSGCSLALKGTPFGDGSSVGEFGTEIGKSSFIYTVVEGSSIVLVKVFFLTWSKCLLTLLPSVRSIVNEAGTVLE